MSNLKEKLTNKIVKTYLNYKFKKIGKVEFRYGHLICNVDMNKVNEHFSTSKETVLKPENESYKKILRRFGYYGKIVYLFKDAIIYGNFKIISPSSSIRFKDCKFSNSIDIVSADEITFQGNINLRNYYTEKKVCLSGKTKRLNFCDAKITSAQSIPLGFLFESDSVSIVDSSFNLGNQSELNITGRELSLSNSKLDVENISLNFKNLSCDNSKAIVNRYAEINLDNVPNIDFISAKRLSLNGEEFIDVEEVIEVDEARLDLLTVLKKISLECKSRKIEDTITVDKVNQMIKKM